MVFPVPDSTICGQQPLMNRIIGGQDAQPGQWPWQVSIERNGVHICGGSLISSQWVVSAAQCIQRPVVISKYRVHLGAFQLSLLGSRDIYINVKNITVNSNYTYSSGSLGDISLLQLQSTVNFTDYILPICLPSSSVQITSGTLCWVTGWGDIQLGVDLPDPKTLQEVQVPIIDQSVCSVLYLVGANSDIQNDMLCAGYLEGGKDSCSRDTGGPLVCQFAGSWLLAGIVSWGEDCALPRYPGVYTRASYYADWIAQYVQDIGFTLLAVTQVVNTNLVSTTPNTTISKGASATTTKTRASATTTKTTVISSAAAAATLATATITTTITTENSTSMVPQKQG
ncbi:serine protease 27-like [Lissotriton helveticus]